MDSKLDQTLKQLLRLQQEQYRYQTVKTSFATDLVFKVLPLIGIFALLAMILDLWKGGAR